MGKLDSACIRTFMFISHARLSPQVFKELVGGGFAGSYKFFPAFLMFFPSAGIGKMQDLRGLAEFSRR